MSRAPDRLHHHAAKPAGFPVGDWLRKKYPSEFGSTESGEKKLLIIHTNKSGEVSKKQLDEARKVSREIDDEKSPINCIVSVMILREAWDVQSVTVIVGLRPYTSNRFGDRNDPRAKFLYVTCPNDVLLPPLTRSRMRAR